MLVSSSLCSHSLIVWWWNSHIHHWWSGVPPVPDRVAPGFAALKNFHRKMIKNLPRSSLSLTLSPSTILCWERTYVSANCDLGFLGTLVKILQLKLKTCHFFPLVWLCGPLWSTEVVERQRLSEGWALGSRSRCFSALSWMQLQLKKNRSENPQWFVQDFHPRWGNPYETVWVFCSVHFLTVNSWLTHFYVT